MALNMIPEKISTRFRIGIIGPGSICVTYGNALKASDTVSLACICGRDTGKGKEDSGEVPGPLLYGPGADVPERGPGRGPHLHPHLYP